MAIRARDYIGIAEGIKSQELSEKAKIEQLKNKASSLSSRLHSIGRTIDGIQAEIAAAYEDTDENGTPNYARISALEAELDEARNDYEDTEDELDETESELQAEQDELQRVMEEKAQTLFDIQERARTASQNAAAAGGTVGDYAGVGQTLQGAMLASYTSLSQAASILDGSVSAASVPVGGASSRGSGRSASGGGGIGGSALGSFASDGMAGGASAALPSAPTQYSSRQSSGAAAGMQSSSHAAPSRANGHNPLRSASGQISNGFAAAAFAGEPTETASGTADAAKYASDQQPSPLSAAVSGPYHDGGTMSFEDRRARFLNSIHVDTSGAPLPTAPSDSPSGAPTAPKIERRPPPLQSLNADDIGVSTRSDLAKKRAFTDQLRVGFTPVASPAARGARKAVSGAPHKDARERADERDYEVSLASLLSVLGMRRDAGSPAPAAADEKPSETKREAFLRSLKAEVQPLGHPQGASSAADDDDPGSDRGALIRQRGDHISEREQSARNVEGIKDRFAAFMRRESPAKKTTDQRTESAQQIIDAYTKTELSGVLSADKIALRLSDSVEFQDDEAFAKGYGGAERAKTVNGYNNGEKSYVKNSGPHPRKTAIHEHVHMLSCNDIKDRLDHVTQYRRGISINGRDRQVNEALTEFFTKKMMGAEYPANPDVGYKYNMMRIEKMAKGFGEDLLKEAYFQNKPELMRDRYESVMGEGTWATFSKVFDASLLDYTEQEIWDISEHYRKTGKRLVTRTDDIRKKAAEYADRCAAIFAERTKEGKVI